MLQSFLKSSFLKDFSLHIGIETKEEDENFYVKGPSREIFSGVDPVSSGCEESAFATSKSSIILNLTLHATIFW